jgi:hypothetical protein
VKKWIKKHSKICICILGISFIAVAIYGFTIATEPWQLIIHTMVLLCWIPLLLSVTGVFRIIGEWWDKE